MKQRVRINRSEIVRLYETYPSHFIEWPENMEVEVELVGESIDACCANEGKIGDYCNHSCHKREEAFYYCKLPSDKQELLCRAGHELAHPHMRPSKTPIERVTHAEIGNPQLTNKLNELIDAFNERTTWNGLNEAYNLENKRS